MYLVYYSINGQICLFMCKKCDLQELNDIFIGKKTNKVFHCLCDNESAQRLWFKRVSSWGLLYRWGEAKHKQPRNTGEVPTCLGSQIHLSNKLFVPSAQCPEGLSCLMNEEKCRVVGNTCQPQCALIHSCVFSMESIKQRRHDLFFRCRQTISLDQNQQRTEPSNKYHHDVFSLITLLSSSSALLSKIH